ncbi:MAG: four helix bundle protein [Deltaproteobacteria bacterium]|nr:four helix bundle protein [Deltaproteobacteria bacterium]
MKVVHFQDLTCWKKSRELVNQIYQITNVKVFSQDFSLKDQLRRASVSVMANIAEGFGSTSRPEFRRFLSISIRSAYEVHSHLFVALDVGYLTEKQFKQTEHLVNDCINLCKGFVRYLNKVSKKET